jgi:DNA-binding LacI/PurR family transcriptional regulator
MNRIPQRTSLVTQTAGVIRDEIRSGRWSHWLPGEYELCAQLHVSRRTVRAALDQLRQEGMLKCRRGKRRRIIGRRSSSSRPRSHRVVLLMPVPLQSVNPFGLFLIDRLREDLAEQGYLLETRASRVPYRARLPEELNDLEATSHPAGWVLLYSTEQMQRWFAQRHLPCVVVGSRYRDLELPSVDTDYGALCRHAVGQFVARGHRRLMLLNPRPGAGGDVKTEEGFRAAVLKTTLRDVQATVVQHDGTVGSICGRVNSLMRLAQPPTAFLVSRSRHVLTVLGHLLRRGFRLPQDVALISRDDDSYLEDVVPTVARYTRNSSGFAAKVSRVVLDVIHGAVPHGDSKIMPNFVPGETLG